MTMDMSPDQFESAADLWQAILETLVRSHKYSASLESVTAAAGLATRLCTAIPPAHLGTAWMPLLSWVQACIIEVLYRGLVRVSCAVLNATGADPHT